MRDVNSASLTFAPKGMYFFLGFAGSRRGWFEHSCVPEGKCVPAAFRGKGHVGSWMTPDTRFCNPNQITSCYKASLVHSRIMPFSRPGCGLTCSRRITGLIHKTTVCFGAKCYVHKEGVCMHM